MVHGTRIGRFRSKKKFGSNSWVYVPSEKVVYASNRKDGKMNRHESVVVDHIPKCNFCDKPGIYDCKIPLGSWADLCQDHFTQYGCGLGLGRGQKRILRPRVEGVPRSVIPAPDKFDAWMEQVNRALLSTAGLGSDELPDKAYRDYYDLGMDPKQVAKDVLDEELSDMEMFSDL